LLAADEAALIVARFYLRASFRPLGPVKLSRNRILLDSNSSVSPVAKLVNKPEVPFLRGPSCESEGKHAVFLGFFPRRRTLSGAPATRRIKSYSASSGYAYQYFYEGRRDSLARRGGTEYVFSVSSLAGAWRQFSVEEAEQIVSAWQVEKQRELSPTERYAVAKLTLLEELDRRPVPEALPERVLVTREAIDRIAETLGWG
jgi:hypothetical protein